MCVLIRKGTPVFGVFSALKISENETENTEREHNYNSLNSGKREK
jgi:hypothetical protein